MSPDEFSEVTSESWSSRIGNSLKGIVVGLAMFLGAFPLLFWNEGRAVSDRQALSAGLAATVSADRAKVDPANEGKPVHMMGKAETQQVLADNVFGVSAAALRLVRKVEMYQWIEKKESTTQKKVGGGTETKTTYTYVKDWSDQDHRSADFKHPQDHANPSKPFGNTSKTASDASVGAFKLPADMTDRLSNYTPVSIGDSDRDKLPPDLRGRCRVIEGGFYVAAAASVDSAQPEAAPPAAGEPKVGDCRVTFKTVLPGPVSLVAMQAGDSFAAYLPKPGGLAIKLISDGTKSTAEMYKEEQAGRDLLTWVLRAVGFLLMGLGLQMTCGPLQVAADVIPFIGDIVGGITGFLSFLLALPLTLVTIALAWVFYRPILGIPLLVAGLAGVAGAMVLKSRKVRAKRMAAAPLEAQKT